jgi:hypothetical protein
MLGAVGHYFNGTVVSQFGICHCFDGTVVALV